MKNSNDAGAFEHESIYRSMPEGMTKLALCVPSCPMFNIKDGKCFSLGREVRVGGFCEAQLLSRRAGSSLERGFGNRVELLNE